MHTSIEQFCNSSTDSGVMISMGSQFEASFKLHAFHVLYNIYWPEVLLVHTKNCPVHYYSMLCVNGPVSTMHYVHLCELCVCVCVCVCMGEEEKEFSHYSLSSTKQTRHAIGALFR